MKKGKLTLVAQTILQLDAGVHEVITSEGGIYVKLQSLEVDGGVEDAAPAPAEKATRTKSTPAVAAAEVVDDTAPAAKPAAKAPVSKAPAAAKPAAPARTRAAATPIPEPVAEVVDDVVDGEEITEDQWATLQAGDLVDAQLNMEGEEGEKLWEAEIVGFKKPKGSKEDKLYVKFLEDGSEDYLRDGDRLFEKSGGGVEI